MEKNSDPKTLLSTLDNSLAKIKTLLAWLQLKRLEVRVDQPPAFVMYDPTPVDLRNELLFFMLVSQQLRDIVNDKTSHLSTGKRNQIRLALAELERNLDSLDIPSDFECGTRGNSRFKNGTKGFF
jgi:hypothetical protein